MVKAAGRHVARRWFPGVGGREVAMSAGSIGLASVMLVTTMAVTRTDQATGRPLPSSPPTVSSLLPPTSTTLPPPTSVGPPPTAGQPGTTAPGAGPPLGTSPSSGGTPTTVGGGRPPGPPPPTTAPPPATTTRPPPPTTTVAPAPTTTIPPRNKARGLVNSGRPICYRIVDGGTKIQQPCNRGNQP